MKTRNKDTDRFINSLKEICDNYLAGEISESIFRGLLWGHVCAILRISPELSKEMLNAARTVITTETLGKMQAPQKGD